MPETLRLRGNLLLGLVVFLLAGVFALDLCTPTGYTESLLYLVALAMTIRLPQPWSLKVVTVVVGVLAVLGGILSPESGEPLGVSATLFNRVSFLIALVAVVGVAYQAKETTRRLEDAVTTRTVELTQAKMQLEHELAEGKQRAEALRQAHERAEWLARFPNENPNPVLRVSADGVVLYCNPTAARTSGWECRVGQPVAGVLMPLVRRAMAQRQAIEADVAAGERTCSVTVAPFPEEGYANIYGHEVTARTRAEDALRGSEQRERERAAELAALLEAMPAPVFIAHDPDCHHLTGNRAADELLKNPRGAEASLSAPPDSRPRHFKAIKDGRELAFDELPAQRAARGFPVQDFEFSLVFEDGSARHVLGYGTPLRDDNGLPRGAVHVLIDITERKRAEEDLQRAKEGLEAAVQERTAELVRANRALGDEIAQRERAQSEVAAERQRFEHVLDQLPAYLILLAPDHRVPFANRFFEERFGESRGHRCFEYLFKREAPCENCESLKVLQTKAPHRWEWTGPDERNYEIYDYPFTDVDGSQLVMEVGLDVTERKAAEAELARHRAHLEELVRERTRELEAANATLQKEIAERKQAEAELRRANGLLDAVTKGTNVLIMARDTNLRVTYFNSAYAEELSRLTGKESRIGDDLGYLFGEMPEVRDVAEHGWRAALSGETMNKRVQLGDPARYRRTYSSLHTPIRDADGRVIGAGAVIYDVTEQDRVMEALRSSEATLRGILNATQESIWLYDPEGLALQANSVALARLGRQPAEVIGRYFKDILPPALAQSRLARLRETVESGMPVEFEDEHAGIQFHHSFCPVKDVESRVTAVACFSRDISEQRKAEKARQQLAEALRRNQERQEILANTASRLLGSKEPQRIVKELCERVMAHLGCHAFFNFLVDEKAQRLHLNAWAGIRADEAKAIEWLDFGVAVCGCVARQGSRIVVEDMASRPDPRTELVRSFGLEAYACHPLLSQGRVIGTLSFGTRNRTAFSEDDLALMKGVADLVATAMERVRAEERLRETRDYLDNLLNHANAPIIVWDSASRITHFNHAFEHLTGRPAREVIGQSLDCLFPRERLDDAHAQIRRARAGERWETVEIPILHTNGSARAVLWNSATLFGPDGATPVATIAQGRDVTEQRQAEAARKRLEAVLLETNANLERQVSARTHELERANAKLIEEIQERKRAEAERSRVENIARGRERLAILGELAAGVAHELRNPLQGVIGYMDLVKLKLHDEKTVAPLLMHMEEGLQEMDRVAAQLLDLSRQDQEPVTPVPLGAAIERAWAFLQVRAAKQGVSLSQAIEPGLPLVTGNPARLTEAFLNIFKNALDALNEAGAGVPGEVKVVAHVHPRITGMVEILISDNGMGIPADIRGKVFEPFFTTKPSGQGTGLGLAMVRKMVESCGGYVELVATREPGTTIGMGLPVALQKQMGISQNGFVIA